ncbi:MAG: hypothetical protein D6755_13705, partial [Anaerolineae bacterium]
QVFVSVVFAIREIVKSKHGGILNKGEMQGNGAFNPATIPLRGGFANVAGTLAKPPGTCTELSGDETLT